MLDDLLDSIEIREDSINLAIDADGLLFLSCYSYKDDWNIEYAYMNFCGRVESIKREMYKVASSIDDVKLCFSAKKSFMHDIYPDYKLNRSKPDEDAKKLRAYVTELKKLIYSRVKGIAEASTEVEADLLVIMYAYKGYYVSAMDSDVKNQCPTPCFNFHSKTWSFVHMGLYSHDIYKSVLIDSIAGKSKDNVKGVKGSGKVGATKFVNQLANNIKDFSDYVDLFDTPEDMLMNVRLCDMSQYKEGKLNMTSVADINNMILGIDDTPF